MVLDAFLDSVPNGAPPVSDGPKPVAAYSTLLFSICEGRCYRFDEIERSMANAGLQINDPVLGLPAHGSILIGKKND